MLWFDPLRPPRVPWVGLILAVLLAFTATACGFRPLHGPQPAAEAATARPTAAEQLARTRILRLANREGQRLHNLLRDRLNPAGPPREPAYDLALTLTSTIQKLGIRKDETASRANLILNARYTLKLAKLDSVVARGRVRSVNSYNILDEFFATTVTQDDALKRGLREIANSIALRLAIHFAAPLDAPEAAAPGAGNPP